MPHWIGPRIRLREYREEDLPHIRTWTNDGEVTAGLNDIFLHPHAFSSTEEFVRGMMKPNDRMQAYIIADRVTEAYIGQIDMSIDWKNRTGSLGISIGMKEKQGQGIGEEAIRLLTAVAFEQLDLHRVQLEVYGSNERAYRCYKRCGFMEEGRLRQRIYRNGVYEDEIWMGIMRDEFDRDPVNELYKSAAKWQFANQA